MSQAKDMPVRLVVVAVMLAAGPKHEDKPEATTQAENSCLGHKG